MDGEGNIYVTGTFEGALEIGAHMLVSAGSNDIFLAKLTPEGEPLWARSFGNVESQYFSRIAVHASGEVVLLARLAGTIA